MNKTRKILVVFLSIVHYIQIHKLNILNVYFILINFDKGLVSILRGRSLVISTFEYFNKH